ncbi:MAG: hypothetical protein ACK40X_10035 [Armatimonadota bacterium]
MRHIYWLFAVVGILTISLLAFCQQPSGLYAHSPTFNLGLAVPSGWQRLSKAPHGYPTQNFLFGWQRSVGKDIVGVIVVSRLPVVAEGPTSQPINVDLDFVANTFTDYFSELGASTQVQKISLAGRDAVAVFARGVGNGIAINPRIGTRLTRVVWCGFPLSPSMIVRIQFGALDEVFDALLPDFHASLQTFHFGPPSPLLAKPIPSSVSDEQLVALIREAAKAKPQTISPPILPPPTVPAAPTKEQILLAPEQWEKLEIIAKEKGISVGTLLRQIVDEVLKQYSQTVKEKPKE